MQKQSISLTTAILMNINIMVGSGILIGPGQIAKIAGNASFLAWPIAAFFLLPIVMSTVQLSKMFPGAGGFYSYAKEGLSQGFGFIAGWLYIVGYTFGTTLEVLALKQALLVAVGDVWPFNAHIPFTMLCVGLIMVINSLGVRVLSNFLNAMTLIKLLPIITLIISIPLFLKGNFSVTATEISLLPAALTFPLFGLLGFEYCSSISHLIKDSQKNAPRAILFGFLITVALYTLFNFGLLHVMGVDALRQFGASAFVGYMGISMPLIKVLFTAFITGASVLTLFAGATGMFYANTTLLHTLAEQRVLRGAAILETLNAAGRPWIIIILQGCASFALAIILPSIAWMGGLTNLCVFASFVLPFVSLLIMQRRQNKSILLTALAIIAILFLTLYTWYTMGDTVLSRGVSLVPALIWLVCGFGIYRRKR